jgi:hypothetical protein
MTTSFARGPAEKHRVWYELLHGNRGMLIWDDKYEMVNRKGEIGPRGEEVKPYYNELRGGLGTLLMNSERQSDPVASTIPSPACAPSGCWPRSLKAKRG